MHFYGKMKKQNVTFYDILGVGPDADTQTIKEAYRKISKKVHPDVNGNDKYFEEYFKKVSEAYETLSDKNKRSQYDALLNNRRVEDDAVLNELQMYLVRLEAENNSLNLRLKEIATNKKHVESELEYYKQAFSKVNFENGAIKTQGRKRAPLFSPNVYGVFIFTLIGTFMFSNIFTKDRMEQLRIDRDLYERSILPRINYRPRTKNY